MDPQFLGPEEGDLGQGHRLLLAGEGQVQHPLFNGRFNRDEDLLVLDLLLVFDGVAGGTVEEAHHHLLISSRNCASESPVAFVISRAVLRIRI
jgi:hypothetical protein